MCFFSVLGNHRYSLDVLPVPRQDVVSPPPCRSPSLSFAWRHPQQHWHMWLYRRNAMINWLCCNNNQS